MTPSPSSSAVTPQPAAPAVPPTPLPPATLPPTPTSAPTATPWQDATFPNKPITLLVSDPPGSDSDALARNFASFVEQFKILPQPIVVENRTGDSGASVLAELGAHRGDAYIMSLLGPELYLAPILGKSTISYRDLTALGSLGFKDYALVVRQDSKYIALPDLLNASKAASDFVKVGEYVDDAGVGACVRALEQGNGTHFGRVPLKTADVAAALLDGRIDFALLSVKDTVNLAKSGQARVISAYSGSRIDQFRDVPTVMEQGLGGACSKSLGFLAPWGIASNAATALESALQQYTKNLAWKNLTEEWLLTQGWMDHNQFGQSMGSAEDSYRWLYQAAGPNVK